MALEQYAFGAGALYMLPLGLAAPQPVQVGTLQETSIDISWTEKMLQGSLDAPVGIARGPMKVSGKIKNAKIRVADLSQVIFGTSIATGQTQVARDEGLPNGTAIPAALSLTTTAATATGSTLTFASTTGVSVGQSVTAGAGIAAGTAVASFTSTTVTLTQPVTGTGVTSGEAITFGPSIQVLNALNFVDDLGVVNVTTGIQMTLVASAPATGQYSVSAGVYEFAAADAGSLVAISYEYTQSTAGKSFTYYAKDMGRRPTFKMVLTNNGFMNNPSYAGQPIGMTIYNAGITKFAMDFKNEDWIIPESDFSGSSDFMGRVFKMGADE